VPSASALSASALRDVSSRVAGSASVGPALGCLAVASPPSPHARDHGGVASPPPPQAKEQGGVVSCGQDGVGSLGGPQGSDLDDSSVPPCAQDTRWGTLASTGWFGCESLAELERGRIAVLVAVRNSFYVPAVEGNWPRTGPWHVDGWTEEFGRYCYGGHLVSIDPFGDWDLDDSGVGCEPGEPPVDGRDIRAGGFFPIMLDDGDWWIFCRSFLLLEAPI
jgi:hypothetical protein